MSSPLACHTGAAFSPKGDPHAWIEAAVCGWCPEWATQMRVAEHVEATGNPLTVLRASSVTTTVLFTCDEHADLAETDLLDSYGYAVSNFEPNRLVMQMEKALDMRRRQP